MALAAIIHGDPHATNHNNPDEPELPKFEQIQGVDGETNQNGQLLRQKRGCYVTGESCHMFRCFDRCRSGNPAKCNSRGQCYCGC